ncbi:MAG: hypothetical protein IKT09_08345 [Synergistes sp.]|nr:hypothetical protein [Synergistes sp.]
MEKYIEKTRSTASRIILPATSELNKDHLVDARIKARDNSLGYHIIAKLALTGGRFAFVFIWKK